jgi:hypothetical protein
VASSALVCSCVSGLLTTHKPVAPVAVLAAALRATSVIDELQRRGFSLSGGGGGRRERENRSDPFNSMRIITVCRLYCTNVQYAGAVGTPRTSGHCSRLVAFRAGIVSCQPTWHHPRFRGSWVMVMALAAMHAKYVQPPNQEPEGRKDTYCSAAGGTATTVLPPLKKAILWRCTRAPFLVCTARLLLFFFLGGGGGGGGWYPG